MDTDANALSEIRKGLDLLFEKGDVVELRVPRDPSSKWSANISGFFDDLDKLAVAIHEVNTRYSRTVYVTMNPLKLDWQSVNNIWYQGASKLKKELEAANQPLTRRMKEGTDWKTGKTYFTLRMSNDNDVLKRRWILIDVDAGQPAGMNSNDLEKADALKMATETTLFLESRGFPTPALTNSGNGYHVYVRIDFENSLEMKALVRRFLKALGQKFNGTQGTALVDEGMYNAARITKAAGSFVFKGANTPKRPQRRSSVISVGTATATVEQVKSIADAYVLAPGETFSLAGGVNDVVDDEKLKTQVTILKKYLDRNKIKYGVVIREDNGAITLPCVCPNAVAHTTNTEGGTLAVVRPSGAFGFCCQHAHCEHLRSWKGFRTFVDAGYAWTNPNDHAPFPWSLGTVTISSIEVAERKPVTKKARVKAARVNACAERLAPLRAANPNGLYIGENTDTRVQVQWLLEKICSPSCYVKDANEPAAELGISKWTLQQGYPAAGILTSYADRQGARLVRAATLAEANKLVMAGLK